MQESQPFEQKKDEPLDKVFNEIKAEFAGDKSVEFSLEKIDNGGALLSISFMVQKGVYAIDPDHRDEIVQRINKILSKNQFESRERGRGGLRQLLLIDPKFVDGKINWRRWVPGGRSAEFSKAEITLLDEASVFTELSDKIEEWNHDDYGKFNSFIRLSPLTFAEKRDFGYKVPRVFR
jgi:hypothetical protein